MLPRHKREKQAISASKKAREAGRSGVTISLSAFALNHHLPKIRRKRQDIPHCIDYSTIEQFFHSSFSRGNDTSATGERRAAKAVAPTAIWPLIERIPPAEAGGWRSAVADAARNTYSTYEMRYLAKYVRRSAIRP